MVNNFTLPELSEFVMEEYSLMVQQASRLSKNGSQVMIERNGIKVRNEDILKFQKEDQVSLNIIMIFLEYLNSLQSSYRAENKNSKNRNLFYAVEISTKQDDPRQIKYKILEPNFRMNLGSFDITKNFDKIVILLSVDGRWIVSVFHIAKQSLFIIDFLSENLSNIPTQKLCEDVIRIVQKELGDNTKVESLEYYEDSKLNYLTDCSLYVLNYAYKCMNTTEIENIVVKFQDKELFRKKLFWLLFKIRDFTKPSSDNDNIIEAISPELKDKSSVKRTSSRPKLTQKKTTESSAIDFISFPTQSSSAQNDKILETNMFSEKRDLTSSRRLETKILNRVNSSKLMTKAILPLKTEKVIKKNTTMTVTESIQSIKDSILLSNSPSPPRKIIAPQPQLSNKNVSTIEVNPKQLDQILKNLQKGKIKQNSSSSQNLISSSLLIKDRRDHHHQHPLKMRSKHHVSHDHFGSLGSGSEKSVQKFIQNFANLKLPPILEPKRPKMVIPPYQLYNPKNFFTPDPMEVLMNHYGYPKSYTEYIMTMKKALMKDGKDEELVVDSDDSDDLSLFGNGNHEKPSKEKETLVRLKGELHKLLKSQKDKYLS